MKNPKYTPYIRRLHRRDKTGSFRVAMQMALHSVGCYVLVQRRCGRKVLAVGRTKRELLMSLPGVMTQALRRGHDWRRPTLVDFRRWAARVGEQARSAGERNDLDGEI